MGVVAVQPVVGDGSHCRSTVPGYMEKMSPLGSNGGSNIKHECMLELYSDAFSKLVAHSCVRSDEQAHSTKIVGALYDEVTIPRDWSPYLGASVRCPLHSGGTQ